MDAMEVMCWLWLWLDIVRVWVCICCVDHSLFPAGNQSKPFLSSCVFHFEQNRAKQEIVGWVEKGEYSERNTEHLKKKMRA